MLQNSAPPAPTEGAVTGVLSPQATRTATTCLEEYENEINQMLQPNTFYLFIITLRLYSVCHTGRCEGAVTIETLTY